MKRTYLPSELPTDERECINVLLGGCTIKNPYSDDFFELHRMEYAIKVLNNLITGKIKEIPPKIKKFKIPKMFKELKNQLEDKMTNWKL